LIDHPRENENPGIILDDSTRDSDSILVSSERNPPRLLPICGFDRAVKLHLAPELPEKIEKRGPALCNVYLLAKIQTNR
jgi:hypothetical protein